MRRSRRGGPASLFLATLLSAAVVGAGPAPPSTPMTPAADPLLELAATFREGRLRMRQTRPDVPPELSRWDGPLHHAMTETGRLVAARRLSRKDVTALLGPPDETFRAGEDHNGKPVPRGETHLVYWWRGGHDTLIFVLRRDVVAANRWWFALE